MLGMNITKIKYECPECGIVITAEEMLKGDGYCPRCDVGLDEFYEVDR